MNVLTHQQRLSKLQELQRRIDDEIQAIRTAQRRAGAQRASAELDVQRERARGKHRRGQTFECGTEQGYQQHRARYRDHGTGVWPLPADDPCGCKAAHAEHQRLREATKGGAA